MTLPPTLRQRSGQGKKSLRGPTAEQPEILFVSREVAPYTFGGIAKLFGYVQHARRLRFRVMTLAHPGQRDDERLQFLPIRLMPWLARLRLVWGLSFIVAGWWHGWRVRPAAVVGNALPGACVAVPLGLLLRCPCVSIIYEVDLFHKEYRAFHPLERWFRKSIMGFALRHSDRIVCGCAKVKREMVGMFGIPEERVVVDAPGVDAAPDGPAEPRPDADLVVLAVGSVRRNEGFEFVIRAMPRVRAQFPRAVLLVVGKAADARYSRRLRELVKDLGLDGAVRFVGRVEEVWPFYKMCDVFVAGSYYQEGFCLPPREAAACGKPVVATEYLAQLDAVVGGETGLTYPDCDPDALADALLRLARDAELRAALGNRARSYVRQFTWRRSADQFEDVLLELLPSNRGEEVRLHDGREGRASG